MPSVRSLSLSDGFDGVIAAARRVGEAVARNRERLIHEAILRPICDGDQVKEEPVPTMQCKNCDLLIKRDISDEDIAKEICPECLFVGTLDKLPRPARKKPGTIRCDPGGRFVAEFEFEYE